MPLIESWIDVEHAKILHNLVIKTYVDEEAWPEFREHGSIGDFFKAVLKEGYYIEVSQWTDEEVRLYELLLGPNRVAIMTALLIQLGWRKHD